MPRCEPAVPLPLERALLPDGGSTPASLDDSLAVPGPDHSAPPTRSPASVGLLGTLEAPGLISDSVEFGAGDTKVLVGLVFIGATLLSLSLIPGFEAAVAVECTTTITCTYTEGVAFYHFDPMTSVWQDGGREGCCKMCAKHPECVAAISMDANSTAIAPMVNCMMYATIMGKTIALDGASLCTLPSDDVVAAGDSLQNKLETVLGASAILGRFAGFAAVFAQGWLMRKIGYGGAGIGQSILKPRQAAAIAAREIAAAASVDAEDQVATAPRAASWKAIAENTIAKPQLTVGGEVMELRFGFGPHDSDFDFTGEIAVLSSGDDLRGKLALIYLERKADGCLPTAHRAEQAAEAGALALIVVVDHTRRRDPRIDAWCGPRDSTIPVFVLQTATFAMQTQPAQLTCPAFGRRVSTWAEARLALGLSVRQAVWSCGSKLLLWHWSQPLSYFAVFGVYYCSLDDWQRRLGMIVAVREAVYLVSTLLALWLNPSYLLLELDGVLCPAEQGKAGCSGFWRRVDRTRLKVWALYLLAPHHYVTVCLLRWAKGRWSEKGFVVTLVLIAGFVQGGADCLSALALTLLMYQSSSPPVALAIGYWLTTAGLVAGAGGAAPAYVGGAWSGFSALNGRAMGCCERALSGLVLVPVIGGMFLLGVSVLLLAPLQLGGAVHGLACPGGLLC